MSGEAENDIRILIADDHFIVRMGLVTLFENTNGFTVVGEAENGDEAVKLTLKLKPDVVIMDLRMPIKDGVEATRDIIALSPETKVLVITTFDTSDSLSQAIRAGATGALLKNAPRDELLATVRAVARDEMSISQDVVELIDSDPPVPQLSARQAEVLQSATRGLTNQEIGRMLGISPNVVKIHLRATFQKLGAANRSEAVAIALRKHLVKV